MNLGENISWTYIDPIFHLRHSASHIFFSKRKNEPLIKVLLGELWLPLLRTRIEIVFEIGSIIEAVK